MAKTKISQWSIQAAANTDINNIDIDQGCSPANINNAIREMMKQVRDLQGGYSGDTIPVASGGTGATTASAARTNLGITNEFGAGIITGMIIMWSGTIAAIPSGFLLCNGSLGTPDLRNKFVICADADSSGAAKTTVTGAATQTGGTKDSVIVSHTHTSTGVTNTIPDHVHAVTNQGSYQGGQFATNGVGQSQSPTVNSGSAGGHVHTVTNTVSTVGVSGTNQNLVPYYSLAYIMKS